MPDLDPKLFRALNKKLDLIYTILVALAPRMLDRDELTALATELEAIRGNKIPRS